MTVEELQKACAALSEAWVKAMEPLSEEKRKIHIVWKCKSHRRLPDSKMSTYAYKPVGRRNLPYQRRNF
jgi:hypothetical protein